MTLDPKSLAVWVKGSRATEQVARELDRTFPSPNDVGTYPGHGEIYSLERGTQGGANAGQYAIDRMTASALTPAGRAEGDRIAGWVISHAERLGVRYVIWNRRIWSRTGPTPGRWRGYTNPVASRRGTPSGDHTNHVHISRFCDQGYSPAGSPVTPSTPASPGGDVLPGSTSGKAPHPMSDASDLSFTFREDQPLTPGDNIVWLGPVAADGQHPLSILTKPSAGVDVTATLDIRDADGNRAPALEALWRTVAYQKGKPTTTVSDEI